MALIVQKFGGSSVANAEKIRNAARRAIKTKQKGNQVVVVVSARGDKTDELIELAREITSQPPAREMDMLLSTGEQESVALLAMAIQEMGEQAISFTGAQIGIVTDSSHTKARIRSISTDRMRRALEAGKIVIAAGFQGIDEDFNITTLGRGGSDTTAVALAAVLKADFCEIFTDVEGVFSTDPRIVPEARKIGRISYDEMLELASLGAGVMHSRSIEFANKFHVPLYVKPSYSEGEGTLIAPESEDQSAVVTGVALVKNEARVTLGAIPDRPGVMKLVFSKLALRKIPIDMIVQDVSEAGLAQVSFTVPQDDLAETLTAAQEAVTELQGGMISHGTNVSKVSVVGSGMRTNTGVASKMFKSLADAGINIGLITTSDIKISVLVDRDQALAAVAAVHKGFQLEKGSSTPPSAKAVAAVQASEKGVPVEQLAQDVVSRLSNMEDIVVSDVSLDDDQARVTIHNLPDLPGTSSQVFATVAAAGIMVDLIVQNAGHQGQATLSLTVPRNQREATAAALKPLLDEWKEARLTYDDAIAKLSVMGIGLRSHTGVGDKMFQTLADANINVQMISTSEIRISTVVSKADGKKAQQVLTQAFDLE
ncbi:MAG: aspartate kinase [Planctomycetaceae bacterium]|nr:aspartate kinase [Planctomycetaceae bacterium]